MGKLDWKNILMGVGVGGVDEGMVYWDEKAGRSGNFTTATDIYRVIAVLAGGLGVSMGYMKNYAEPILQSATPLLTKSVIQLIRSKVGTTTATARVSHMNIPTRHVAMRSSAPIAAAGPGFENVPSLY